MRLFALAILTTFFGPPATGDTIRVAVTRGQSLRVEGRSLMLRTEPGQKPVAAASPLVLELVGPFVSTGDRLVPTLSIEDASGQLTVGGVPMAGRADVVASPTGLVAVDVVDLELYVASVVGSEMPAEWPAAALEAQAIATRTYALQKRHPDAAYDVEATVTSQVYRGRASMAPSAVAAARATQGQVITFAEQLAETYFFASCSGTTESAEAAFGHSQPYLRPVSCELSGTTASWSREVPVTTAGQLFEAASLHRGGVTDVVVESRTTTGRVASVRVLGAENSRTISGADLRRALGYQTLPSLDFTVRRRGDKLVFDGRGAGHGVGLCQWCAREMAGKGRTAAEILAHFYPGANILPMSVLVAAARP